jgi:hypothetical protein
MLDALILLCRICILAERPGTPRQLCQDLGMLMCLCCVLLQEDDVAIIGSKLGWAPTTLPTGSTLATAVALPILNFGTVTFLGSNTGLINNPNTVHVYSINASAGVATVSCEVPSAWINNFQQSNLNCQLRVISAAGTQLAIINPTGYTTPGWPRNRPHQCEPADGWQVRHHCWHWHACLVQPMTSTAFAFSAAAAVVG